MVVEGPPGNTDSSLWMRLLVRRRLKIIQRTWMYAMMHQRNVTNNNMMMMMETILPFN